MSVRRHARFSRSIVVCLLALVLAGTATPDTLADRPSSACLLPEETLVFVSVLDVPDVRERLSRTALGALLEDPAIKPIVTDLRRSIEKATAEIRESVGLTVDDLLNLPQGELTVAVIPREEGEPAPVFMIDTGDQIGTAKRLIQVLVQRVEEAGNTRSAKEVGETTITFFESVGRGQEDVAFFKRDNTLVWSNQVDVLEQVLAIWDGEEQATLAKRAAFGTIMQQSRRHNPKPQITWYVNPLAIFEQVSRDRLDMQLGMMVIPVLGLDGVKAAGGAAELDAGPYDSLWHAHLVLDKPREGVVKLVAPKRVDMTPPDWVPVDASNYVTLRWDLAGTVDTARTLFDTFRGEGSLDEFITSRMSAPLGVDVLSEIMPALTGRVTLVQWIDKPIGPNAEAGLLAVELHPEFDNQEMLRRAGQKHAALFMRREFSGEVYYEMVPPPPPRDPDQPPRRRQPRNACFGIVDDTLIVADRDSFYKAILMTMAGASKRLAEADDFQNMIEEMGQLTGGSNPVMVRFQRPAERTMAWYEPIREQQQQQTEDSPGRRPRGPFAGIERSMRNNPLPPFESLRKYFPPGGAILLDDDSGLHYTGFTMKNDK